MKVAIMGAAGWVGRAVLESFAGRHQVRAFDYSPEAWATYRRFDGEWEGGKLYGDIADFDAVHRTLEGMDGVVHLAAYFGYENPPEVDVNPFLINLKGMWNVLESARRHQLKRVVHMSSCVVQHPDGVFSVVGGAQQGRKPVRHIKAPAGGNVPPVPRRLRPANHRFPAL